MARGLIPGGYDMFEAQEKRVDAEVVSMMGASRPPPPPDRYRAKAFQPICAICATRVATELDEIDHRLVAVCRPCRDEGVPDPGRQLTTQERVLRVLKRSDGLDIVEIAQALGEDDELGRAKLCAALVRAFKAGRVTYTGTKMDRTYHFKPPRRIRQQMG